MPPLKYHAGQLLIQAEANTTEVAGKLAFWVGPIIEFVAGADLILLAILDRDGMLRFTVLSGKPPLSSIDCSQGWCSFPVSIRSDL